MTFIFFLLNLSGVLSSQDALREVGELYYQGYYERAIQKTDSLLAEDIDTDLSANLHKYAGFCYVALEQNDKAIGEFRLMLELDSTLTLDPLKVSPKIVQVFEEARADFLTTFAQPPKDTLGVVTSQDSLEIESPLSFRRAVLFSTLTPGLGQVYSGNKLKGWGFIIGEGLSMAGLVVSQICTINARDAYVQATEPDDIEAKYRVYNNWYRTRNALGGLSIGIWVSAPLDLVFFPPRWAKNR